MSLASGRMLGELAIAAAVKGKAPNWGSIWSGSHRRNLRLIESIFAAGWTADRPGRWGIWPSGLRSEPIRAFICRGRPALFARGSIITYRWRRLGRIAGESRYALGRDYHEFMTDRLRALADWLREIEPKARMRCCVDTGPVMEKELAARAGIGWVGKNTCVINEGIGSWIFLGEVLTTLALRADESAVDRCGSCRRCIDACPTQAITEPYRLDARKCISYLTIEHRGEIEPELASKTGDWVYGCDVCQDVCPWNREPPATNDPALKPRWASGTLDPAEVAQWTGTDYQRELRGSAMRRVKLPMLKRNADMAIGH